MTLEERRNPAIINGSRRLRIARGSGTTTHEVNSLLKQFAQARKMMKSMMGMAGGRRPGRQVAGACRSCRRVSAFARGLRRNRRWSRSG